MSVVLEASVMKNVNFAACHCGAQLISSINIKGDTGQEVILSVCSVPKFLYDYKEKITLKKEQEKLSNVPVCLDDAFYRQEVLEARDGIIQIEIYDAKEPEKILAFEHIKVHLQPYLHWNRSEWESTLTAFMQPNEPLVARVLNRAGELANAEGGRMVGYQNWPNSSIAKQAEWIFKALQEEDIHYLCPPAGFEFGEAGQKIRIPGMMLNDDVKQGTCLDLAIIYASCLEAASLNPILFLIHGHAFAGVWLQGDKIFTNYPCRDWAAIHQLQSSRGGILMPVECTFFTDGLGYSFESAVASANNSLDKETTFHCALDVYAGRLKGYVPAYTFTAQPICDVDQDVMMDPSTYGSDKMGRLLKQAMDFSLRNALLSKSVLLDEIRFTLNAEKFFTKGYSDAELFGAMHSCDDSKKVEETLYDLYSIQRQEKQQTGQGSLYLTINELEWIPKGQKDVRVAPLYLCPAEIYRNIRGDYCFRVNVEDSFFNPVLKEFLYQEYGIDLTEICNVPESGYSKQIHMLNYAIGKQQGWRIVENISGLSAYRIQNQAIWKGLQDEHLLEHDIVHGFIDGAMTWENDVDITPDDAEDENTIYAFQADSSQSEVIASTFKKRAQVIIGPAGNGKSQTIANIITEHMRKGQSVLFVTEKPAAMEVVANMLDQAELSPFYLMMPDGKGSVAGLHEKVDATLRFIANYHQKHVQANYSKKLYKDAIEHLNQFYEFMKKEDSNGKSLAALLEEYEQYPMFPGDINWKMAGDALNHESAEAVLTAFAESMKGHPEVNTEYLPYLNCIDLSEEERQRAGVLVDEALDKFYVLQQKMEQFLELLKLKNSVAEKKEDLQRIMTYAAALKKCPVYGEAFKAATKEEDDELSELMQLARELMKSTPGSYHYEDVGEVLWNKVDESVGKDSGLSEWSVLNQYALNSPFGGFSAEQMRLIKQKQTYEKYVESLFKLAENRPQDEKEALEKTASLLVRGKGEVILNQISVLNIVYKAYVEAAKKAETMVVHDSEKFALLHPEMLKINLLREWKKCQNKLMDVKIYSTNFKKAEDIGLASVTRLLEEKIQKGEMASDQVVSAFRKGRCQYNIEKRCKANPEWSNFAHVDYGVCLKQYRENEAALREHYRKNLIDAVISHMPDLKEGSADAPELGVLQRLIRRNSKQASVYKIFEEAPHAMQQLFPCIMMGPESVAEYIPSNVMDFDIVIFDEASQLPSYKALIPISKGKKCLFIGDEKQLTPTTFFRKNILDEDGVETPEEAILEDAIVTSMPQKMLRYHYRSKYENLVAFSNSRYYHGEIVTFPGCDTQVKGVQYIYVEDGCYDRGGARNNSNEAKRVIELIGQIYAELPEDTRETLGVITFNLEQMKLIRSMIRQAVLENHPQRRAMEELVDVVNLEACQGKEWDMTILSTAYGPDIDGNFSSNLGPMTRDDGGNRLNVMITRSRKQLYVVSSMTPDMFGDEQKAGNRDLKDFLAFAKGDLQLDSRKVGVDKDAYGLMGIIVNRLEEKGYQVHTNIGSSSCKVDIGVVAEDGSSYQLGILVDHFDRDHYYVRDEEVIIPGILENKGWKLYRLHALNWYENADYEIDQIEKMLKK